jgi:hypothetical protein
MHVFLDDFEICNLPNSGRRPEKFVNGCENCLTYITTNSDFVINFTNCGENDSANVGEYLKNLTRDDLKNNALNYSLKLLLRHIR